MYATTRMFPRCIEYYKLALAHRSRPIKQADGRWVNNERLEYLGDAVLSLVVADYLYHRFPSKREGFLTSTRAKIVQRESLNRMANELKLGAHIHLSISTTTHNSYVSGNVLEALVGAVYLDHGYEACRRFIVDRIIEHYFNVSELVKKDKNFKSRLIEWTQKYHLDISFELLESYCDQANNMVFRTAVIISGHHVAEATGYSKKESHQAAAKLALDRLSNDQQLRQQVLLVDEDA